MSPLQDVVACITSTGLSNTGTSPDRAPHRITFLGNRSVRLQRSQNAAPLLFTVRHWYAPIQHHDRSWSVETTGWVYQVDDAEERELFAYHWHPTGHSHVTRPHLHISGRTEPAELGDAHFPTGPVTLADIVRLVIQDFDVRPRRADWSRILDAIAT